jgi:hypothetical protein
MRRIFYEPDIIKGDDTFVAKFFGMHGNDYTCAHNITKLSTVQEIVPAVEAREVI